MLLEIARTDRPNTTSLGDAIGKRIRHQSAKEKAKLRSIEVVIESKAQGPQPLNYSEKATELF
jgi:hypothetical protein